MTEPTCINLMERFGKRYRIEFDPAYSAKNRPRDSLDPWMMLIPCQRGVIYPHGGNRLAVEIDGRPISVKRLEVLGCTELVQDGDSEKTFTFDVVDFAKVAKEHSTCPSSRQGGDLGEFGPGEMVKEFDEVVFSGALNTVHGPVKTQFGYHLLEVTKRTE